MYARRRAREAREAREARDSREFRPRPYTSPQETGGLLNLRGLRDNFNAELAKRSSIPRPLPSAIVNEVEKVSERFACLLHMTISLAFDDAPTSTVLVEGKSMAEYVAGVDYRRIVRKLLAFRCCHPEDLTSLFGIILVYLRQMKKRCLLSLLEQMVVWFDVGNVLYCVAFLAHVWLLDDPLPLSKWHAVVEGVVKGVNLNKCVRNCLRILKHQLFVTPTQGRAALLSLEYGKQVRRYSPTRQRAVQQAELKKQRSAPRFRGPFGA
jgi:hypothetical protein